MKRRTFLIPQNTKVEMWVYWGNGSSIILETEYSVIVKEQLDGDLDLLYTVRLIKDPTNRYLTRAVVDYPQYRIYVDADKLIEL